MSEQQPLLSGDPEAGEHASECTDSRWTRWRERTAQFLESPPLHKAIIALIIIDAGCVLADLGYAFLSDTCMPAEGEDAPAWLEVLAHISLAITTLFVIEIPLALWSFGPHYYNPVSGVPHAALHIFDAAIITITFILEVGLKGREQELASLLIIFRLWRLVKLVGGVAVGAGEIGEENDRLLEETRIELQETRKQLAAVRQDNSELRKRITTLGGSPPEPAHAV